ncbi:family 20 glycosylhydrolase, partial [Mariniphaga sediminis]|uniref:family 20 glycosylhydrolase n=1 Tax=Mariniphaga sediminis TaxID=1628158 RepID=UPI00356B5610
YSYEPIPEELSSDESKFIIGAQGCVWTEFISNIKVAEFMLFPRICALAEMVWTPKEKKDYNNFESRMNTEYNRFDMWGINYKDYRK